MRMDLLCMLITFSFLFAFSHLSIGVCHLNDRHFTFRISLGSSLVLIRQLKRGSDVAELSLEIFSFKYQYTLVVTIKIVSIPEE